MQVPYDHDNDDPSDYMESRAQVCLLH